MSVRFLSNAGRIIMSKAGFEASLTMPDEQKIFDSNWMATGLVISSGIATVPTGSGEFAIPFPYPLHYAPAAMVYGFPNPYSLDGRTDNTALYVPRFTQIYRAEYIIFAVGI